MTEEVPKTIKVWRVTGYDGLDSLKYNEEPVPEIGDSQVLVKSKSTPNEDYWEAVANSI